MCLFIETIRIENGTIHNLAYHNERLNRTRNWFWKNCATLDLTNYIQPVQSEEVIKCRVLYDKEIREITYAPYSVRSIDTLRVVCSDEIDYTYKSIDREYLSRLYALRETADDILIVKKELITDTSIANIALYNGSEWHTPKSPLLKGTQRAFLLDQQIIKEEEITLKQLFTYSRITLFNAMITFRKIELSIDEHIIV